MPTDTIPGSPTKWPSLPFFSHRSWRSPGCSSRRVRYRPSDKRPGSAAQSASGRKPHLRLERGWPSPRSTLSARLEDARDHRHAAERDHRSPAEKGCPDKDGDALGNRAQRDREQRELEPDDEGVVNEIDAVGACAEAVEDRSASDSEPTEECDEGKADCAAAQDEGDVTEKAQAERQRPMSDRDRQNEHYDDSEP